MRHLISHNVITRTPAYALVMKHQPLGGGLPGNTIPHSKPQPCIPSTKNPELVSIFPSIQMWRNQADLKPVIKTAMSLGLLEEHRQVEMCQRDWTKERQRERDREVGSLMIHSVRQTMGLTTSLAARGNILILYLPIHTHTHLLFMAFILMMSEYIVAVAHANMCLLRRETSNM